MATLSNPITKQNIVDRFADYVRDTANSGISWGTNAYPFGEWDKAYLFGGDTGGKGIEIDGNSVGSGGNGEIAADSIYQTLIDETYRYTRIRNMTAILFVDGGGGNTGSRPNPGEIYRGTAVTNMNTNYLQGVSAGRDDVYANNSVTAGGLEVMFSNMRSAYNGARGTNSGDFQTNVCHASCHSSCHGSRGRR